jgi:hypothetical protein
MIPSIEERQVRPCTICYFGHTPSGWGSYKCECKYGHLSRSVREILGLSLNCPDNFTHEELRELINNHNKGELE